MKNWAVVLFILMLAAGGMGFVIGVKVVAMVAKVLFWIFLAAFVAVLVGLRRAGEKINRSL
jgi:uncharacterized membrane protein YtjA (UPF0391 family)